jgi:hypothetical protein
LALSCNPVHGRSPAIASVGPGSLPGRRQPLCSSPACISSAVVFSGYNGVTERWPYRVTPFWSLTCHRQTSAGLLAQSAAALMRQSERVSSSAVVFSGYNGVTERWPYRVTPFRSLTCHRQRRPGSLPSRRQPLCSSPACIGSAVVFSGYNGVRSVGPIV